jgi:hypothetical protein
MTLMLGKRMVFVVKHLSILCFDMFVTSVCLAIEQAVLLHIVADGFAKLPARIPPSDRSARNAWPLVLITD